MRDEIEEMLMSREWEKVGLKDCKTGDLIAIYDNPAKLVITRVGNKDSDGEIVWAKGAPMNPEVAVFRASERKPRVGDVVRGRAYDGDNYENFLVDDYGNYCSLTKEFYPHSVSDVKVVLTADGTVVN